MDYKIKRFQKQDAFFDHSGQLQAGTITHLRILSTNNDPMGRELNVRFILCIEKEIAKDLIGIFPVLQHQHNLNIVANEYRKAGFSDTTTWEDIANFLKKKDIEALTAN